MTDPMINPYNVKFAVNGVNANNGTNTWTLSSITTSTTTTNEPTLSTISYTSLTSDGTGQYLAATGYDSSSTYYVYTSADGGLTWTNQSTIPGSPLVADPSPTWVSIGSNYQGTYLAVCSSNSYFFIGYNPNPNDSTGWSWTNWTNPSENTYIWSSLSFAFDPDPALIGYYSIFLVAKDDANLYQYYKNSTEENYTSWVIGTDGPYSDNWTSVSYGYNPSYTYVAVCSDLHIFTGLYNGNGWNWKAQTTGAPTDTPWSSIVCRANVVTLADMSKSYVVNVATCSSDGLIYTGYTQNANTDPPPNLTWTQATYLTNGGTLPSGVSWNTIVADISGRYLTVCRPYGIYSSSDFGGTWTLQTNGSPTGVNWSCLASDSTGQKTVAGNKGATGSMNGGSIYVSPYYSNYNWTTPTKLLNTDGTIAGALPINSQWTCLASDDSGQYLFAIISGVNTLYYSQDYGITWYQSSIPTPASPATNTWTCIACTRYSIQTPNNVFRLALTAYPGNLYISNDSGSTWTQPNVDNNNSIANYHNVALSDDGTFLVLATSGFGDVNGIWTGKYDGTSWTFVEQNNGGSSGGDTNFPTSPAVTNWAWITTNGAGTAIAACTYPVSGSGNYNYGYLFTAPIPESGNQNDQWTWTNQVGSNPGNIPSSSTQYPWYNLTSSQDGTHLAICSNNGAIFTGYNPDPTNSTSSWTWTSSLFINSNIVLTGTQGSWTSIVSSRTGQYIAVSAGSYGSQNPGYIYTSSNYGINWSIQNIYSQPLNYYAFVISGDGSRIVTAVNNASTTSTLNCGIFISELSNTTWSPQTNGSPANANWFGGATSANGINLVNITNNAVYRSSNYGMNWNMLSGGLPSLQWSSVASSTTGQYIAICATTPSQQSDNTGIYTSVDYGNTWVQETNGLNPAGPPWHNIVSDSSGLHLAVCAYNGSTLTQAGVWLGTYNPSSFGNYTWTQVSVDLPNASTTNFQWITMSSDAQNLATIINIINTTSDPACYVYYSRNGGQTWTQSNLTFGVGGIPGTWWCMSSSSSGQYVVAVAQISIPSNITSTIYISADYGATWSAATNGPPFGNFETNSLAISNNGNTIVAIASSAVFISHDRGTSWQPILNGLPVTNWGSVSFSGVQQYQFITLAACQSSGNNGYNIGGGLWFSHDNGVTWTQNATYPAPPLGSVNPTIASSSTGQNLAAFFNPEYIYTSQNYGQSWTQNTPPNGYNIWQYITSSSTGQYLAAVVFSGGIFTSSDFGNTWIQQLTGLPPSNSWAGICSSSTGQNLFACANGDYIYASFDYGQTWTQTSANMGNWTAITSSSSGQYLVATNGLYSNYIYYSKNYGQTWLQSNSPAYNWFGVTSSNSGKYVVAFSQYIDSTVQDYIYYSFDYGAHWSVSTTGSELGIVFNSITSSSSGQYVEIISSAGSCYVSTDYGQTWSTQTIAPSSTIPNANSIVSSSSGQYLAAVTADQTIYTYSSNMDIGNNWLSIIEDIQYEQGFQNPFYCGSINCNSIYKVVCDTDITCGGNITCSGNITCDENITCNAINTTSDIRVKNNINQIDINNALLTIRDLNPKTFHYISKQNNQTNKKKYYGFVAQEVDKVFSDSISKKFEYIPNINEEAIVQGDIIILDTKKTAAFLVADTSEPIKIKIYINNKEKYVTIKKIIDDKSFQIMEAIEEQITNGENKIMVYGQGVNDFHLIEKDAIFTLTTAAVKQLDKELQETKDIVNSQQQQINNLMSELETLKKLITDKL